jgi:hypothetical protein
VDNVSYSPRNNCAWCWQVQCEGNMRPKVITYLEPLVFLSAASFFRLLLLFDIPTDLQGHMAIIRSVADGTASPPGNFLYYLSVYSVALFQTKTIFLQVSTVLLLSLAVTAKFTLTRIFLFQTFRSTVGSTAKNPSGLLAVLSLLMLVVFSLPADDMYLGQIPPNVFHNSTTIFLMPFAFLLWWISYRQMVKPTRRGIIWLAVLAVANVLIKPSFFMVFAIAYPLMLMRCYGIGKTLLKNLIPVVVGAASLGVMYFVIFRLGYSGKSGVEAGIVVRPFSVWSHWSSNIGLSLLASLAFPIVYCCMYPKDLRKHVVLQYAVVGYVIAMAIFVLLSETGPRELHGNLFWQCVVCSYILFTVLTALFAEKVSRFGLKSWKNLVVGMAFTCHAIAGAVFLLLHAGAPQGSWW